MMLINSFVLGAILTAVQTPQMFSEADRTAAMDYWREPGRYSVVPPKEFKSKGLWQVRLTVAGSTWLWNFNKARGVAMKPTTDMSGTTERDKIWDAWVDAKIARDRWEAGQIAANANMTVVGDPPSVADTTVPADEPKDPGPLPPDLIPFLQQPYIATANGVPVTNPALGDPPPFAEAVVPMEYRIKFDDGTELSYQDNTKMRAKYAYYRFDEGVIAAGRPVKSVSSKDLDGLIKMAGITDSEARVMKAVSILEGGFDSVNTYDTGYVSVGFIQFASLRDGAGSLGKMLLDYKSNDPVGFQKDFRKFGLEVTPMGALAALDVNTGMEVQGPDANRQIIRDKRLIAVFQRAGLKSATFNAAQIRTAKSQYYPAEDTVDIGIGGISLTGRISDFIKSEAGMATLMDRKVNTGSFGPLAAVLQKLALEKSVKSFPEFAKYERQIIEGLKYRKDYLADKSLSQPK
jgi:hypothetical protein